MENKDKPKGKWVHDADDSDDFIYYETRGSPRDNADRDASFKVYLPADANRRHAAINLIVDALNKSGIRP